MPGMGCRGEGNRRKAVRDGQGRRLRGRRCHGQPTVLAHQGPRGELLSAVMRLLRLWQCRRLILPQHLRLLMVANLLEGSEDARENMRNVLYKNLMSRRVPMKYAPLLIVNVVDSSKRNAAQAREQVGQLVEQLRDHMCAIERLGNPVTLSDPKSVLLCPEYILPDLVYILAHYPSFEDYHPNYEPIQMCLYVYFEAVTKDTDNTSFLYTLLQTLKRHDDALQPKNKSTKLLCDIAFEIVHNEYGKTKTVSGKPFPGSIMVPKLFTSSSSSRKDTGCQFLPSAFKLIGKARALRAAGDHRLDPGSPASPRQASPAPSSPRHASPTREDPSAKRKLFDGSQPAAKRPRAESAKSNGRKDT
eukprot:NODE_64_length_2772_cov_68.306647_g60_i0.p1 GENE.NODE_64_length_2772_cov_68.306647_g60_i0~~NODE_64_length_2772_cov_68.306647_g60_i0.p1  ORF type:complete len:359 (-),score=94.32 NODE_64_length_2772_cov_68.306647_g60_i0:194-1270(-)